MNMPTSPGLHHDMGHRLVSTLGNVALRPYWADTVSAQTACPPLLKDAAFDLVIVGGGFTGLWTALLARRRMPDARIAIIEAGLCGQAASGRNGGFCAPSISHGTGNAVRRWPGEADTLVRLGRANLEELANDITTFGIEAEFELSGKLILAEKPWQVSGLQAAALNCKRFGIAHSLLDREAMRGLFNSPKYRAGLYEPNYALLNPVKMVAGLRHVALAQGTMIHENTSVLNLRHDGAHIVLETPAAALRASKVVLATNAAPPLLRRLKKAIIPIFDYAIMTRPLTDDEVSASGWTGRYGVADCGNQFHYARKTADNRILWGGYDAIYHYSSARNESLTYRPESFNRLALNFAAALPALAHVPFTHAWGGVIDTSARTTFFAGRACKGNLAYALGFTGQGVSASRFAALTMLDLLEGADTERTRLSMVNRPPFSFPPEPLRSLSIALAQKGLAREDEKGKRSLFLKGLDALGIGFDS